MITDTFSTNAWRYRISNGKESDKCDMCKDRLKVLWVAGRYTTDDLPTQDLGHIQHTCEAFSDLHTAAHHPWWRLIHGDLSRLAFFRTRQYNQSGFTTVSIWTDRFEFMFFFFVTS